MNRKSANDSRPPDHGTASGSPRRVSVARPAQSRWTTPRPVAGPPSGPQRIGFRRWPAPTRPPGPGGLFESGPADVVMGYELSNRSLFAAIRQISYTTDGRTGARRPIDYANLGAEELGGIYEGLLEFVPRWDSVTRTFSLSNLAGNERRTSGAYYTPSSLIDCFSTRHLTHFLIEQSLTPTQKWRYWRSQYVTQPAALGTSWLPPPDASPHAYSGAGRGGRTQRPRQPGSHARRCHPLHLRCRRQSHGRRARED